MEKVLNARRRFPNAAPLLSFPAVQPIAEDFSAFRVVSSGASEPVFSDPRFVTQGGRFQDLPTAWRCQMHRRRDVGAAPGRDRLAGCSLSRKALRFHTKCKFAVFMRFPLIPRKARHSHYYHLARSDTETNQRRDFLLHLTETCNNITQYWLHDGFEVLVVRCFLPYTRFGDNGSAY